jgi:hypothetical protein
MLDFEITAAERRFQDRVLFSCGFEGGGHGSQN